MVCKRWLIFLIAILPACVLIRGLFHDCKSTKCFENCKWAPCENGVCSASGECQCLNCWTGPSCNKYENRHKPKFLQPQYSLTIDPRTITSGDHITRLVAEDKDFAEVCNSQTEQSCPCADIEYHILQGNSGGHFSLSLRGALTLAEGFHLHSGDDYTLLISARNVANWMENEDAPGLQKTMSTALVYIKVEGELMNLPTARNSLEIQSHQPNHRLKRAAPIPPVAIPSVVTFYLIKTGQYENVTQMYVGDKIHFQLRIQFPLNETDMTVELLTPDTNTTVMALCNPMITYVGVNIHMTYPNAQPVMTSLNDTTNPNNNIATFVLGNVTNSASETTQWLSNMVYIEWDAVMISNSQTVSGTSHWVTAGAEYNYLNDIWIGQASFTTIVDNYVPSQPTNVNFTGPSQVMVGSSSLFTLDIYVPYPSTSITIKAFAPANATGVMTMCSLMVSGLGSNYACLNTANFFPQITTSSNSALLDLGTVTSAGIRDPANPFSNSIIAADFTVLMVNDVTYIGNQYWIGAAVEFNNVQIWAGNLQVQVIAAATSTMSQTPTFTVNASQSVAAVGEVVVFYLSMSLPPDTQGDYQLIATMPFSGSAQMSVCAVQLVYTGSNIPCTTIDSTLPVYASRDTITQVSDSVVWNLGKIRNTGQYQSNMSNIVTLSVTTQVLNNSLNVNGATPTVALQMKYGTSTWSGTQIVTVSNAVNLPPTVSPTFNISYAFGTAYVYIGASTEVIFEMTLSPGVIYTPMIVEFMMPFMHGSAELSVCRAQLISVGGSMPCLNATIANSSVVYSSKANSSVMDTATFSLGPVCNVGNGSNPSSADDMVVFSADIQVQNHPSLVANTPAWISVGVEYSTTKLWVGQLALYPLFGNPPQPAVAPYITYYRPNNDTTTNVAIGQLTIFYLVIDVPPSTTASYIVTVTSNSGDLNVCGLRVQSAGANVPCVNTSVTANFSQWSPVAGQILNHAATLDLGLITNIGPSTGLVQNSSNSVVVQVLTMIPPAAPVGSTPALTMQVYYGATWTQTVTLTAVVGQAANISQIGATPSFNLYTAPINANSTASSVLSNGQAGIFYFDIIPATNSLNNLNVTFQTPVSSTGAMDICSLNVIYAGVNIPCLIPQQFSATYQSRSGSTTTDIAWINLGSFCQIPINTIDPNQNILRLEAVVRISRLTTVAAVGSNQVLTASVVIGGNQTVVTQTSVTVAAESSFINTFFDPSQGNVSINSSLSSYQDEPGSFFTVQVLVTVPANCSITGIFDASLPITVSADMTVISLEVISAGVNLACLNDQLSTANIYPYYNSTQATSQMNHGYLNLGIITNSGITYRTGTFQPGDNVLQVNVYMQMADSVANTANSVHYVNFSVNLGTHLYMTTLPVNVVRDNSEHPVLLLTATVNSTVVYSPAMPIVYYCFLKHANTSQAEAYNVTVNFYLPPYIQFLSISYINFTLPTLYQPTNEPMIQLQFDHVYFTDIVEFHLTAMLSSSVPLPAPTSLNNITTPYDGACNMIWRVNNQNSSGTEFPILLKMDDYEILAVINSSSAAKALGMQSGAILDCQISGSNSPAQQPQNGRLGSPSGWTAASRLGSFENYIEVNFGNLTRVTQVTIKQPAYPCAKVTTYQLLYSNDGFNWQSGELISPTYSTPPTSTDNVQSPVTSRFIRLLINASNGGLQDAALQVEFIGIVMSSDETTQQICATSPWQTTTNAPGSYSRGFLSAAGLLYYCDANPLLVNYQMQCFSSSDGLTWTGLDSSISNVIGYDSAGDQLYGIANDKQTILSSADGGVTWLSVSYSKYQQVSSLGTWIPAVSAPWFFNSTNFANTGTIDPLYAQGAWGANYNGLYHNTGSWTKVVDWTTCCA